MKKHEFSTVCAAVEAGKQQNVEHQVTHQRGRVVACDRTGFEVATGAGDGKHNEYWEHYNCDRATDRGPLE